MCHLSHAVNNKPFCKNLETNPDPSRKWRVSSCPNQYGHTKMHFPGKCYINNCQKRVNRISKPSKNKTQEICGSVDHSQPYGLHRSLLYTKAIHPGKWGWMKTFIPKAHSVFPMFGNRVNLPHLCVQVSPCTSKHGSPGAQNSASVVGSSSTCSILSNITILPFSPLHLLQVPTICSWEPRIPILKIPGKNRRIKWPRGKVQVEIEVARPWSLTTQTTKGRCVKIHRTWGYNRPRYNFSQIVIPPPRCPFLWCRATPSCPVASSSAILHKEAINQMVRSILVGHDPTHGMHIRSPRDVVATGKVGSRRRNNHKAYQRVSVESRTIPYHNPGTKWYAQLTYVIAKNRWWLHAYRHFSLNLSLSAHRKYEEGLGRVDPKKLFI